jgi:hypothetical protein
MFRLTTIEIQRWVEDYKDENTALLDADPEFRRWLEEEYIPIGGGWQY